jgi:uncharacterized protein (TIGR02300 family)
VAKPELGTKRLCGNCAAKFYDLSKDPIVCPKCQTVLTPVVVSARSRPEPAAARAPKPAPEEVVVPETPEAEFVSLEDADAEAQGKKPADGEAIEGAEALVIATEWSEFANFDLAVVKEKMTTPIIFDGRNLFDPQTMAQLGFRYHSIGRASVAPR